TMRSSRQPNGPNTPTTRFFLKSTPRSASMPFCGRPEVNGIAVSRVPATSTTGEMSWVSSALPRCSSVQRIAARAPGPRRGRGAARGRPPARGGGSGASSPRGGVALLLRGGGVDRAAHRRELEAGDLLVDLLRQGVPPPLERRRVPDRPLGRERLVREGHVHHD